MYHRVLSSCYDYEGIERSCWLYISKKEFPEEAFEPSGIYDPAFNSKTKNWKEEHDSKFDNDYELERIEEEQYQREIKADNSKYLKELHGVSEYDPDIDPSWSEDTTPEDKEALKSLFRKGML